MLCDLGRGGGGKGREGWGEKDRQKEALFAKPEPCWKIRLMAAALFSIDSLRAARGMRMCCAPLLPRLVGLTHDEFQEEFRLGLTWVEEERARRRKARHLKNYPIAGSKTCLRP